jgi:hypothetical protein
VNYPLYFGEGVALFLLHLRDSMGSGGTTILYLRVLTSVLHWRETMILENESFIETLLREADYVTQKRCNDTEF